MTILHGDDRFYNNIFVQKPIRPGMQEIHEVVKDSEWTDGNLITGTISFSGYPSEEEFKKMFEGYCGMGSTIERDIYYRKLPVWLGGNVYFNGAKPADQETDAIVDTEHTVKLELKRKTAPGIWIPTSMSIFRRQPAR